MSRFLDGRCGRQEACLLRVGYLAGRTFQGGPFPGQARDRPAAGGGDQPRDLPRHYLFSPGGPRLDSFGGGAGVLGGADKVAENKPSSRVMNVTCLGSINYHCRG